MHACDMLQGQVHNVCMTANHDVMVKVQYLDMTGQPIELDPGATVEGVIEGNNIAIDLATYSTLDPLIGEVTIVLPSSVTAPYEAGGTEANWELSIVNAGSRFLLIDGSSTFTVRRRLNA